MTMLNDTMGSAVDSAKHTVDSAKKGAEHAASVAFSDITDGLRTIGRVVAQIRSLGVDDALGWIGLSRRRGTLASLAIFGSGVLVGTGVGMLVAPMSGATLRKTILRRLRSVERDAEKVAGKVKDAVVDAEQKVEDVAGKAKDTVVDAVKDVVEGAEQKVNKAKDAVVGVAKDVVDAAEQKAKDTVDAAEQKAEEVTGKAKAGERRNNGASAEGNHRQRHAARD